MIIKAIGGITALTLFISGCSTVAQVSQPLPQSLKEEQTPHTWSQAPPLETAASDNWLARYADENLQALVERMLAQNFDLHSTKAKVRSAELQLAIESGARLPEINGQLQGGRSKSRGGSATDSASAQLNITWELEITTKGDDDT